ncbi:MAG: hypothetical protein ACRDRP_11390 [Pseudonocardiaceae bacterium]
MLGLEGRRDLETAVALGLGIAAVGENAIIDGQYAPFDPAGVEVIDQNAPNLEQIAALRPDLILTRGSNIERLRDELADAILRVLVATDLMPRRRARGALSARMPTTQQTRSTTAACPGAAAMRPSRVTSGVPSASASTT